jgi:hypothetical protein
MSSPKGIQRETYFKTTVHMLLVHIDISIEVVACQDTAPPEPLAYTGRMEVIRQLCSRGIIDTGARYNGKLTSFDLLAGRQPDEIASLLEEACRKWPRPGSYMARLIDRQMRRMRP